MPVYTKIGDSGETSLLNSQKISKSDPIFEVLGTIDELNAVLGFLNPCKTQKINDVTNSIQKDLFDLGSAIACKGEKEPDFAKFEEKVAFFEKTIDELEKDLPQLKNFVIPGGSYEACYLHLARTVCRRLERAMVRTNQPKVLLTYINRLSDLFFVLSRYANNILEVNDSTWVG